MITLTLVAILGALLAIVLMKLFNHQEEWRRRGEGPGSGQSQSDGRPRGDMISVSGAGDDLSDLDSRPTAARGSKPGRAAGSS